jgi:hypothetical protein
MSDIPMLWGNDRTEKIQFLVRLSSKYPDVMCRLNPKTLMAIESSALNSLPRYIESCGNDINELNYILSIMVRTVGCSYNGEVTYYNLTTDALWAYSKFKDKPNIKTIVEIIVSQNRDNYVGWYTLRNHLEKYPQTVDDNRILSHLGRVVGSYNKQKLPIYLSSVEQHYESIRAAEARQRLANEAATSNPVLAKYINSTLKR